MKRTDSCPCVSLEMFETKLEQSLVKRMRQYPDGSASGEKSDLGG